IPLEIIRRGTHMKLTLPPVPLDLEDPLRGFTGPTEMRKYPLGQAVKASIDENRKLFRYTFLTLGRMASGQGSVKDFSGPGTIARISGEMLRRGSVALIEFIALISLQLGIMNLLPIPVLDGGHILILTIEGTSRRDLSIRAKERIQQLGLAVLFALMIVVLYNDVITNVLLMRKG